MKKCCLSKRIKSYSSRTHRCSPQPVACIRGYEPSGSSYSNRYPIAFITRLHFRHQNHNDVTLAANAIKCSAIESYDVKYKYIYIWRNLRLCYWLPDESTYHGIINKTQYKMVCPLSCQHSSCWIQHETSAHSGQSPPGPWGSVKTAEYYLLQVF